MRNKDFFILLLMVFHLAGGTENQFKVSSFALFLKISKKCKSVQKVYPLQFYTMQKLKHNYNS